jgi:hypothetical protein
MRRSTTEAEVRLRRREGRAQLGNVLLGAGLVASGFLWPHAHSQFVNAFVTGGFVVAVSLLAALWLPVLRWANVALSLWLFFATIFLPTVDGGTVLFNFVISMLVLTVAFLPFSAVTDPSPGWTAPLTPDI